ncbi:hypothetical protein [Bacillus phage YungSlug]|nr:hypothetical protein [Bacillus phage YungSlug]
MHKHDQPKTFFKSEYKPKCPKCSGKMIKEELATKDNFNISTMYICYKCNYSIMN